MQCWLYSKIGCKKIEKKKRKKGDKSVRIKLFGYKYNKERDMRKE